MENKKELERKQPTLIELVQASSSELGRALPNNMNPERLVRIATTCIRTNPALMRCTPQSFLGSLFVLAQLGLEPIAGRAYLLPFKNNKKINNKFVTVEEVQAVIGYKGYADLFYRHESALSIDMQTVFQNDDFDYAYGTDSFLRHKPAMKNRGDAIAYYAIGKLKGGASNFRVISKEEALKHGQKYSKTYDKNKNEFYSTSPWAREFDAMAMKTVLLQITKLLPLSVEIKTALEVDGTSRDYQENITDALQLPVTSTAFLPEPEENQGENENKLNAAFSPVAAEVEPWEK